MPFFFKHVFSFEKSRGCDDNQQTTVTHFGENKRLHLESSNQNYYSHGISFGAILKAIFTSLLHHRDATGTRPESKQRDRSCPLTVLILYHYATVVSTSNHQSYLDDPNLIVHVLRCKLIPISILCINRFKKNYASSFSGWHTQRKTTIRPIPILRMYFHTSFFIF